MEGSTMMSEYIGLVISKDKKELIMVINPDYDEQLDFSCWTKTPEESFMIKIHRKDSSLFNQKNMTASGVAYIQTYLDKFLESN